MELIGKNALVLGASRGLGRVLARSLADEGLRLILPWCADWPESAQEMQEEFSQHLCIATDLRCPDSVQNMVQTLEKHFPCLHVIINNIERGGMPVLHGSYQRPVNRTQWQLELDTTLHAKWQVFTQCFHLLTQAEEAVVVNISSIAAVTGRSGPAGLLFSDGYAAANRGIASLTETWARMGAPSIRVNEIMLGLIEQRHGPGTRGWDLLSPAEQEGLLEHSLLRRVGKPEEVAAAVLFLLKNADFMTGACLRLDGGFVLGGEKPIGMPDGVLE
jgi:3-oxoacyl-[acyl-carrier protein] reductase